MTRVARMMNRRVEIREAVQSPGAGGGFDRKYKVKAAVWAAVEPITFRTQVSYVRNLQLNEKPTHTFTMRRTVDVGTDFRGNNPRLQSHYFLWLFEGEGGRRFRIVSAIDVAECRELIMVLAREEEDESSRGTFLS